MQPTKPLRQFARSCLALAGFFLLAGLVSAQTTGTIEGRVLNADNGKYLGNARVTVAGTHIETLTDATGQYTLSGVPAGSAQVKAFYTGLLSQDVTVAVPAGKSVTRDINLSSSLASKDGDVIKLDAFTVAGKVEMDAASIAINEQRFAPTIKNVVSTDAFGDITEGNLGDFVKFLPGVTIDYVSPDARTISVRGLPANYTPVTLSGSRIASANSSAKGRTFELEQISINNAGRVEVLKSRSPETAADALGGAINLVPRSALEQSKPTLSYRAFVSANGDEKQFKKDRGPTNEASTKIKGGFDFVYINPVSKKFGYSIAMLESNIFYPQHRSQPNYAPNSAVAIGPDASPSNPYLRGYQVQDGPKNNQRKSISGTVDLRLTKADLLSVGAQWNYYNAFFGNRPVTYNVGALAPLSFSDDFVNGALGSGSVVLGGTSFRRKYGYTYMADTNYTHTGPIWKYDAGIAFSHATNHYHDAQDSHINPTMTLRGNPALPGASSPTVNYAGIRAGSYLQPTSITVLNNTGTAAIDLADPANYNLTSVSNSPLDSADVFKTARFNIKRDLGLSFPLGVKAGVLIQEETRDIKGDNPGTYTFVGPDRLANTADDNASLYNLSETQYSSGPYLFGTPRVPFPDAYKTYALFKAHPEYFALANAGNPILTPANGSAYFREVISAGYIMGDTRLIDNRLRLSGGVRFERTQDKGYGVLNNISALYQRDASGVLIRDVVTGRPIRQAQYVVPTVPAGSTDAALIAARDAVLVSAAKAQYQDRGDVRSKTYDGSYPSFDASYNVKPNIIARVAYARSLGRPDLGNIIPSTSLPDLSTGAIAITTVNASLKPTQANAYDASLEYYFAKTGVISVGVFRKDFTNFVGISPAHVATLAELTDLEIPDAQTYVNAGATVATSINSGSARVTGVEFNYSQVLDLDFLPTWTRSFTVYANGQQMHLEGATLSDFSNFIPSSASWGVKYGAKRFSAQVNWNYRGRQRLTQSSITYKGAVHTDDGFYNYFKPRIYTDVNFNYRYTDKIGVFVNARNLTNVVQDNQNYGPASPSWSRTNRREEFGVQYTVGVKGSF